MRPKDFLTLGELNPSELSFILHLSKVLKKGRPRKLGSNTLKGDSIALIFEKPSTRTRISFQVAIYELGGNAISLSSNELQLGRGETIEDTAHVMSRYVRAIMARVNRHIDLEAFAAASSVPVINGLSDTHHPVQILADLLTLMERKGKLSGLRVAWIGDGNNVCNSWIQGAALSGIHLIVATPENYKPLQSVVDEAHKTAKSTGGSIEIVAEPDEAVRGADCVITDTFVSMGFDKEREERMRAFLPKFQVNKRLMSLAKKSAIFQHCLPAHRGEEVTSEVLDGPQSVVFDEAENRLHTTKALLCFLLMEKTELRKLARAR